VPGTAFTTVYGLSSIRKPCSLEVLLQRGGAETRRKMWMRRERNVFEDASKGSRQVPRPALRDRDFACGSPVSAKTPRSHPQNGSTRIPRTALGISPAGSRSAKRLAHARKTAQTVHVAVCRASHGERRGNKVYSVVNEQPTRDSWEPAGNNLRFLIIVYTLYLQVACLL